VKSRSLHFASHAARDGFGRDDEIFKAFFLMLWLAKICSVRLFLYRFHHQREVTGNREEQLFLTEKLRRHWLRALPVGENGITEKPRAHSFPPIHLQEKCSSAAARPG
jgi:hypothetical protein